MYRFDETYCMTAKRKDELAKNIGIIQTELDKARLMSERCFEILKEAWHSNNEMSSENRHRIWKYELPLTPDSFVGDVERSLFVKSVLLHDITCG